MDLVEELIEFCNKDFSDKPVSLGPWGGIGGGNWSFNEEGTAVLKQIVIVYRTNVIDNLRFKYELNGKMEYSVKYGGTKDSPNCEIDLDWPREYLINVSGYFNKYLSSLKFVTNVKEYGPFGAHNEGSPFTLDVQDGMIVGFHGRCGAYLDSIGVYVMQNTNVVAQKKQIRIGPWGGSGGSDWIFNEEGIGAIKQIVIIHGDAIDSIAFRQELDGKTSDLIKFGGSGGSQTYKIDLDWPREYIVSISGYIDEYVRSLTIVTNVKEHGPYGPKEGSLFTLPMQGGRIVGFHGRCIPYLDSIGVYIKEDKNKVQNFPKYVGPWGGDGGHNWDVNQKGNAVINQIIIRCGNAIDSIAFTFELNGRQFKSERFGGGGGGLHEINFEPDEYIINISGCWGPYMTVRGITEYKVVKVLRFVTNKREFGPFGRGDGHRFGLPIEGKIVGFHGRSSKYLDAIGFYMKP